MSLGNGCLTSIGGAVQRVKDAPPMAKAGRPDEAKVRLAEESKDESLYMTDDK